MPYIQNLSLRSFRSYSSASFALSPGMNFIHGDNGLGKTNLLEALSIVCTGRSFRTPWLKETIAYGAPSFFLHAQVEGAPLASDIRLSFDGTTKKLELNDKAHAHFTPLLGQMPLVILAPEDGVIISGPPSERRRFLDLHLSQTDPLYLHHLVRYHKALKQRNAQLRLQIEEGLDSWEEIMMESGLFLQKQREKMLQWMIQPTQEIASHMAQKNEHINLAYNPSQTPSYKQSRPKDLERGTSMFGPHRDHFEIQIGGVDAAKTASQGQKRSLLSGLKLSLWKHLQTLSASSPILCIDDVGMHLDPGRLKQLLEITGSYGQTFLTAPTIPHGLTGHLIHPKE